MGGLDGGAAAEADARFEAMLERSFSVILPGSEDFGLAREYLGVFETGLRAWHALHLAIASNHDAGRIYTLDKALVRAGNILGLPVAMGIETT